MREVAQPQVDDIAVFSHGRSQEAELIAQISERVSQQKPPLGPGRQLDRFRRVRWHRDLLLRLRGA